MSITHIFQSIALDCPFLRAQAHFERTLSERSLPHAVRLHARLFERGPLPISLHADALVTYSAAVSPRRLYPAWLVRWTPTHGGPYPDFSGTLTLCTGATPATSALELSGDYVPPLGAAGRVFDAAVGSRIASAAARGLLEDLATFAAGISEKELP